MLACSKSVRIQNLDLPCRYPTKVHARPEHELVTCVAAKVRQWWHEEFRNDPRSPKSCLDQEVGHAMRVGLDTMGIWPSFGDGDRNFPHRFLMRFSSILLGTDGWVASRWHLALDAKTLLPAASLGSDFSPITKSTRLPDSSHQMKREANLKALQSRCKPCTDVLCPLNRSLDLYPWHWYEHMLMQFAFNVSCRTCNWGFTTETTYTGKTRSAPNKSWNLLPPWPLARLGGEWGTHLQRPAGVGISSIPVISNDRIQLVCGANRG